MEERYQRKKSEIIRETGVAEIIISKLRDNIERTEVEIRYETNSFDRERIEIRRIEANIIRERELETNNQNQIKFLNERIRKFKEEERVERVEEIEPTRRKGETIEERYDYFRRQLITAIEGREFEDNEYTRRYKEALDDLAKVHDYIIAKRRSEQYEKSVEMLYARDL